MGRGGNGWNSIERGAGAHFHLFLLRDKETRRRCAQPSLGNYEDCHDFNGLS